MRKHLFFFFVFISAMILAVSCKPVAKADSPKPDIILTENQLVDVMTDAQLLEAALNHKRNIGQQTTELKTTWYNELFEHHQITEKIFQDNLNYYSEQPEKMEKILEEVLARISQMQSEVNAEKDSDSTKVVNE